jgi:DNA-binding winged helix-turn-helix (wHTH) protein
LGGIATTTLRFAEFVFDEQRRQLFRGDEPVHLEPKAFELLALLLSRRPNALGKPEIREAIWPDTSVSESSLPGLVGDLRAALGDDGARPQLIRTVRGYGYAFCGAATGGPPPAVEACRWVALQADREVPLPDGTHLIGRGDKCLIRCTSIRVSRCHAQVRISPDRVVIEDLGSRNGTWLRGERIQGASEIQAGDTVRVGPESIRFVSAGSEASTVSNRE